MSVEEYQKAYDLGTDEMTKARIAFETENPSGFDELEFSQLLEDNDYDDA